MKVKTRFQKKFGACLCMVGGKCRDCKPDNCKKNHLSSPVIFCADKIFSGYKRNKPRHCDEIVLCNTASRKTGVYCIEHKGGNPDNFDMEYICDQLQGGADIVFSCVDSDEKVEFAPVLVSKKGGTLPPSQGITPTVKFKGREYQIEDIKIGEELEPL